ncbi:MAG: hypothetical protein Q7J65_03945 [Candidatus Marinimicrobia bacterium]|nr:hypothetical protein [Candidatus Neomarinimicrobiota bacterium]
MADELKIDFGNTESCNTYLMSKFDDLLTGINNLYGKELMNELIHRLEKTIAQFHKDVKILITDIQSEEAKQSFRSGISALPKPQNNEFTEIVPEQASVPPE